jgi:HTH-type transcriptional regulator / antitoxin HipB
MRSLKSHLQKELQDSGFKMAFEEELRLAQLAVQIAKNREDMGMTQAQLASRAHLTQQQVSKVEHAGASGFNVNTLIRVCEALGLDLTLSPRKPSATRGSRNSSISSPSKRRNTRITGRPKSSSSRAAAA